MNFTTIITDLSQMLGLDTADTTNLANMKRWTNNAYKDISSRYRWSWLYTQGRLQSVLVYKTGTVSTTLGSRTVTGDSTAFTSAMVGRYFNCTDNSDYYRIIAFASGTSLTLDKPYARSSVSGKNYYIWKKHYSLNTDCQNLLSVYIDDYITPLRNLPIKDFSAMYDEYYQGIPTSYLETELDKSITTYSTGTVSGSINTRTLTGSSTVWLDNLTPGDDLTVDSYTYNVLTVDSDTQVTLATNLVAAVTGGTSYSASRTNVKNIQFNYTPDEYVRNVTYKYIKSVYDMQNDNDKPDMPEKWHHVITLGAGYLGYQSLDDPRRENQLQLYEGKIKQMIKEDSTKGVQPSGWTRM